MAKRSKSLKTPPVGAVAPFDKQKVIKGRIGSAEKLSAAIAAKSAGKAKAGFKEFGIAAKEGKKKETP